MYLNLSGAGKLGLRGSSVWRCWLELVAGGRQEAAGSAQREAVGRGGRIPPKAAAVSGAELENSSENYLRIWWGSDHATLVE